MSELHADASKLVDYAIASRQELREIAVRHEAERRVESTRVAELEARGAFRLLVPKELGGGEVRPLDFVRLLDELAQGDAATAWCVMTGATTGLLSAYMPEDGAREIWQPGSVTAGVFAPMGKAKAVDGGYVVSGRWPFASGCENANWWMGGARCESGSTFEMLSLFFPSSDGRRHDTWSTLGLRGTGSHDIEVEELFVPARRVARVLGGQPRYTGPLFRFPLFGLLAAGVAAVGLGIARAALEDFKQHIIAKRLPGGRKASSQGHLQLELARAEGELEAGRALLYQTCDQLYSAVQGDAARQGDLISSSQRAQLRLAANQAVRGSKRAVDTIHEAAGGAGVYTRSPFEKHLRDIHTLTQHVMVQAGTLRQVGAVMLDEPVDTAQL
ncbi:MAG: acyl-CoA dehydrogenase family protein [Polyangiaceae bacterium]|nr:acyl-CoA dehydrogenase family protein [Myxococcales bacterium]MCB9587562.1 acyl-CoA dehydrogenase family protein [Polyangiaceae bacterium]MCB9605641.1 acyl-CoA dehydrogenase family protein [Polyangiaceae bacterium]